MLLADAAQAVGGKLYILGGGWSVIGPGPTGMAIALKIDVPWHQANVRHRWAIDLVDEDGQPVKVGTGESERAVQITGEFQLGHPKGVAEGSPIDLPLAINIGALALPAATRCVWQLSIDGASEPSWRLPFTVRST